MAQTVKHLPTMRETWVQSLGQEDPLQNEMAIHSNTIAWKIPWTEEPGRLQSMGSQRVGHGWATSLSFKWPSGFPYFRQFKPEFCHKELTIWATVCSRSCFCWLYKNFPSSAAKNIISLISLLTIWWCPCVVFSCVVGKGCLLLPVRLLHKILLAFALLHFVLQGNLACYSRDLLTFTLQFSMIKRISFCVC